ncbi:MAG: M2 family metallopeptidase [Caldiserica bacterium]|nr:M2 family metallopeptidase [Caldisericota bacterium]
MEKAMYLKELNEQLNTLSYQCNIAAWNLSTSGKDEYAAQAEHADLELRLFLADKQRFDTVNSMLAAGDLEKFERRQLTIIHDMMVENQLDKEMLQQLVSKQIALQGITTKFRGTIDGREVNNKQIEEILRCSNDNDLRKKAWLAGKQVGPVLEPGLLELIKLRNESAVKLGYANYYDMEVRLQEFDGMWLKQTLESYRGQTDTLFRRVKDSIDQAVGQRLGVDPSRLMPWHMSDMFFQEAPRTSDVDLSVYFEGKGDHIIEELATTTYDAIGLDIRDIIVRSDLYERAGKDQHAFCMHIDNKGDVRVLANLRPNETEMETLLHEMGHACYDKYTDMSLPEVLRQPAHIFTTEAVAMFFGRMARDPRWYKQMVGIDDADFQRLQGDLPVAIRNQMLVSTRWITHFALFEHELYRTEKSDSRLWYQGVQNIQYVNAPEERFEKPDWAAKYHFAMAPVYYHNYLLGEMLASQLDHTLRANAEGKVLTPEGGRWFVDNVFTHGAKYSWNTMIQHATGEKLNPSYLVQQFNY